MTKKDDLTKGKARIKQLLKENKYQENNTVFKRITINLSLTHLQQQALEIQD